MNSAVSRTSGRPEAEAVSADVAGKRRIETAALVGLLTSQRAVDAGEAAEPDSERVVDA